MSNENLTAEEKRNIEQVKGWAKVWVTDCGRCVDEYYADTTEVYSPHVNFYWARRGQSKEPWRTIEIEAAKRRASLRLDFVNMVARGDTVAIEIAATETTPDGQTHKGFAAAFMKFDKDGRIVSEHTFDSSLPPSKEEPGWSTRFNPAQQAEVEKLLEDNK